MANFSQAKHVPVLVVGGGPVGLALVSDLGWRGISCMLVERGDGSVGQPKMGMVGVRTMEFCRRWGMAQWVIDAPYPDDYPQDNVFVTTLTGWEIGRERFPGRALESLPAQSPQKREKVPQDMFDPLLQRFARSFAHVTLNYFTELVSFTERADHVEAVLRDPRSGDTEVVTTDYLVGTDGSGSFVRQQLGIGMTGKPALTYTTNVIFRCADLPSLHDKGYAYRFMFIGPTGVWLTIVAINGGDRWRMSIVGTGDEKKHTEEEVRATIRKAMAKDFDFEILSIVHWVRHELIADSFGRGRVFIAGDAAHVMSPTGAFGMNTGIQDAVDLGWKLEAMLRGWGGPALLESYGAERRPVAVRNVTEATRNLGRMFATRRNPPPPEMFEPGPAGDAARKTYGEWFSEIMRPEWYTIGFHLGYRYDDSPIIWPDGTEAPPFEGSTYTQTSRPGARAPHVWLSEGRSTLDLFGRAFILLRLGASAPEGTDLRRAAAERKVPLDVVTLDHPAAIELYGRALVLVRPDGHVAWRDDREPADPLALIDVVRGARIDASVAAAAR